MHRVPANPENLPFEMLQYAKEGFVELAYFRGMHLDDPVIA